VRMMTISNFCCNAEISTDRAALRRAYQRLADGIHQLAGSQDRAVRLARRAEGAIAALPCRQSPVGVPSSLRAKRAGWETGKWEGAEGRGEKARAGVLVWASSCKVMPPRIGCSVAGAAGGGASQAIYFGRLNH